MTITELHLCTAALSNIATAITTPAQAYVAIANDHAAISCGAAQLIRLHRNVDESVGEFDRRTMREASALSPFVRRMTYGAFRQMLADNES